MRKFLVFFLMIAFAKSTSAQIAYAEVYKDNEAFSQKREQTAVTGSPNNIINGREVVLPIFNIRYNQVGYLLGRKKYILIASEQNFEPSDFIVVNKSGAIVFSGTGDTPKLWNDAREYCSLLDITRLDKTGDFKLVTRHGEINFKITTAGYKSIADAALKYYYYNRASTAIPAKYGGSYARSSALPDDEVTVHASAASKARPAGTVIAAAKGWFDAGDYNKYIVNSGISTYTLLKAYEDFPTYFKTKTFNIPEKGGPIPDILDEALWNLEWMLAMQDPNDGGVYHKLTGLNFAGMIMPADYMMKRYVVQKTTAASLDFAAVMATASRIFTSFKVEKPGFSTALWQAAQKAYTWAKANPNVYYEQPEDVKTGAYGDNNLSDEFLWAATELFITSGDTTYEMDIAMDQVNSGVPNWSNVAPLATISMARHGDKFMKEEDIALAKSKVLQTADSLVEALTSSPAKTTMSTLDYGWGSNGTLANQLMMLLNAYAVSENVAYLNAAYTGMDYLLGRNGNGYCYVTGFGDKSPLDPHHRISTADAVALPIPGMLVGGPNPGQQDGCSGYPNSYPATSYLDALCSYATNEVAINWNAPFVYSLFALQHYQETKTGMETIKK